MEKCIKDYYDIYNNKHYKIGDIVDVVREFDEEKQTYRVWLNNDCRFDVSGVETEFDGWFKYGLTEYFELEDTNKHFDYSWSKLIMGNEENRNK